MARPKEQFNALAILDAKDQQLQDQIKEKLMEKEKPTQKNCGRPLSNWMINIKRPITLLKQLKFQIFQVSKQN